MTMTPARGRSRSQGFTLIELLVVIVIIMILAGLILGAAGLLKDRTKILTTQHRMNQVLTGLSTYSQGTDLAEQLQRVAGFDRRFVSLRSAMSLLVDSYGLDLVGTASRGSYPEPRPGTPIVYPSDGHLPPNLGNRWENGQHTKLGLSRLESRKTWASLETNLDAVVTFLDRQISKESASSSWNSPISYWPKLSSFYQMSYAGNFWIALHWDDVTATDWLGPYGSSILKGGPEFQYMRRATQSPLGESLDKTVEIRPDAIRSADWYAAMWPNLVEATMPDPNGDVLFVQGGWPLSDWDQDAPGDVPVVWHSPWGKEVFSRIQGAMIDQIEYQYDPGTGDLRDRTLMDLNPLATIALLQAAGVLPPGEEGAKLYRSDRSPGQNWNDAWGGPLVVSNAMFLPCRYDFDDVYDTMIHGATGAKIPKDSRSMLGGRDFLLRKARESYQYDRSIYVAVGSYGSGYTQHLPATWTAAEDKATLRTLWRAIGTVTDADEWTGESFSDPAWSGIRDEEAGSTTAMVTTPVEIR